MASETLGSEESREKHKWNVSSKVYTRKIHNKGNKSNQNDNNSTSQNTQSNQNSKDGCTVATNNDARQESSQGPPEVPNSLLQLPQPQPQPQPQPLQNLPLLEVASNDSPRLNRQESLVPNGHGVNVENRSERPVVMLVDNRVNINLLAARSKKHEARELKRKLVGELDQVRGLVKQLEAKEIQIGDYSTEIGVNDGVAAGIVAAGGGGGGGDGGYRLHLANDSIRKGVGIRVNSSRPFRPLSVSVTENSHGVGEIVEKEKRTPKANQYYRNSDFVLGKEKFPPSGSNKKSKSGGGKKLGGGEMDYGFGMDKRVFKSCSDLLQRLMKHKHGWVFNEPVDVKSLQLHDYYDIIKHPMDLGTVKSRLNRNWYKSPRAFAEDVRLTFRNAMTYNPKGQDVHIMAEELSKVFEEKWVSIDSQYNRKPRYEMKHDALLPAHSAPPLRSPLGPQDMRSFERSHSMIVPVESRLKPQYNVPVGRTPAPKKPKAKDPHKRDMTYEEKQKLSTNLQNLPSEKFDSLIQIIKRRGSALCQHDDEIEVDIDRVDAETLWELDRFITNYKKSLSKSKRRAELALQKVSEAGQTVQETNPSSAHIQEPEEAKADERNVSSPPVDGEKNQHNPNGSSSSSSSSSDSGSSSSDSDSDSSSGYGSDAGH